MTFDWFYKKNYNFPDFWKHYLDTFNAEKKDTIQNARFVCFDTETTGFDIKKDRILSIGAVSIIGNTIEVNQSFELYLDQEIFKPDTVKIHGLMKKGAFEKVTELEALKAFLGYIKNDVLVAHHANFDFGMINEMLLRHGLGKLKNTYIDTGTLFNKSKHILYKEHLKHYSLDDLCTELNVPKSDRHTASGDALITAIIFLKTLSRLNKREDLQWDYLLKK